MNQTQKIVECSSCGENFDGYIEELIELNVQYKTICPKCKNETRLSFQQADFFSLEAAKGVKIERVFEY